MDLPNEDDLRWIVTRYAHLLAEHGEGIGTPDLVEPTGDFFPDAFSATPEGVATLVKRMLEYAPVADDLPLELAFLQDEGSEGGSCGSGGCGTGGGKRALHGDAVARDEGGYRVTLAVRDVGDPAILATSIARAAGAIVLGEAGEEAARDAERGAAAEIAATACGLGLLLLNGACVYTKSCGGLRAHQATHLDVPSCAVALALFVRVTGAKASRVRTHLEATQREAWDEALRWADSNDALVAALRDHPASLADGVFAIEPVRGALARFFARRTSDDAPPAAVPARPKRERSSEELQRLAETRALVDEALRGD
jgi:hypothetical protein